MKITIGSQSKTLDKDNEFMSMKDYIILGLVQPFGVNKKVMRNFIIYILFFVFLCSCDEQWDIEGKIETSEISDTEITSTSVVCGGKIIIDKQNKNSDNKILQKGIIYCDNLNALQDVISNSSFNPFEWGGNNSQEKGINTSPYHEENKTSSSKPIIKDVFLCRLIGLKPDTEYYVRAFAKIGTTGKIYFFGNIKEFTTKKTGAVIQTLPHSNITTTIATLNGNILDAGIPVYSEKGFCYSTMSKTPTINDIKIPVENSATELTGQYSVDIDISNFTINTHYYVRAYLVDDKKVSYGETVDLAATLPAIETRPAIDIKTNSATPLMIVSNLGVPRCSQFGFLYSTFSDFSVNNAPKIVLSAVDKAGNYGYVLKSINPNTTYYYRAYAVNVLDTVYGEKLNFTTLTSSPSVTTQVPNPYDITTATFHGTIPDIGAPAYTERGFCYSTSSNPTITGPKTSATSNPGQSGTFSMSVSSLSENTTYYVRAYVRVNSETPVYGNEVTFTTQKTEVILPVVTTLEPTNVGLTSATFNGNIESAGNPAYTIRGFCYSTSRNPTIGNSTSTPDNPGRTGEFSMPSPSKSPLSENTTYYVRAFVRVNSEAPVYGNEVNFTTKKTEVVTPVVTTQSVTSSNITTSTAKIYGNITNAGMPVYYERGICYSTSNNPTIESARLPVAGTGTGSFYADITGLDAYITYYARAYAISEAVHAYGITVNFTTKLEKAAVSTQTVTTISGSQVRLNGTIVTVGKPAYTERGFVYGMSSFPTVSDTKVPVTGQGAGSFFTTLNYGNDYIFSYHVRAYAINADSSVSYGEDQIFFFDVQF